MASCNIFYIYLLHFSKFHINSQLDLLKSCSCFKVTFSSVALGAKFEMFKFNTCVISLLTFK